MSEFFNQIKDGFLSIDLYNVILNIIKFIIIYFSLKLMRFLIIKILKRFLVFKNKQKKKHQKEYSVDRVNTLVNLVSSLLKYITYPLLIVVALTLMGVNSTAILSGAGFIGIVLGIGFQDLLKDLIAGFFIVFENQYEINDKVKINNLVGNVLEIGVKTTILRAYEGEIIIINNRDVGNVINYSSANFSMVITSFVVDFNADLDKLYEDLTKYLIILEKKYTNILETPSLKGVAKVNEYGNQIEIHTKVKQLTQYQTRRDLNKDILSYVQSLNYKIAYPKFIIEGE